MTTGMQLQGKGGGGLERVGQVAGRPALSARVCPFCRSSRTCCYPRAHAHPCTTASSKRDAQPSPISAKQKSEEASSLE